MKAIYNTALRERNALNAQVDQFAGLPDPSSNASAGGLQAQITSSITALTSKINQYESLARQEPSQAKREELLSKSSSLKQSLDETKQRFEALREGRQTGGGAGASTVSPSLSSHLQQQQPPSSTSPFSNPSRPSGSKPGQSEVFGRRPYVSSPSRHSGSPSLSYAPPPQPTPPPHHYDQPTPLAPPNGQSYRLHSHTAHAAHPHQHRDDPLRDFTVGANAQLDYILESGRMSLQNLTEQRELMKSTQRKLFSIANTLGISGETIRRVERRAKEDKFIFGLAVAAFFAFAWLVLRFLRR